MNTSHRFFAPLPALVVGFACSVSAHAADAPKDNIAPEGFRALFNGTNVEGWVENKEAPTHWSVADQCLVYDIRTDRWTHYVGWRVADMLEITDSQFNATLLFTDATKQGKVWRAFDGTYKDEKASDGTGGVAIDIYMETPALDLGDPFRGYIGQVAADGRRRSRGCCRWR